MSPPDVVEAVENPQKAPAPVVGSLRSDGACSTVLRAGASSLPHS